MKQDNLYLSGEAINAICALCHKNGTYRYYNDTLGRVMDIILKQGDEIGISDTDAMSMPRALQCLREDLGFISGFGGGNEAEEDEGDNSGDMAVKVEALFEFPEKTEGADMAKHPEGDPAE